MTITTKKKRPTTYDDFKAELLSDPNTLREYVALQPKYDMICRIIERRNQLKLSQTELAKIAGMKQPAIARLEKGDTNITLNTLTRVTDALNLDIILRHRSGRAAL